MLCIHWLSASLKIFVKQGDLTDLLRRFLAEREMNSENNKGPPLLGPLLGAGAQIKPALQQRT
jgi:hypothetical protein